MHPRSPYTEYTDFAQLAKDCPAFAKYLTDKSNINFKDPDAVRELTKSLLKRDFGLHVELPEDRLCPAVPNSYRLNYILWIQDLLDSTNDGPIDAYDPSRKVIGLDIGTGASCIYPLLGCVLRESWAMIGTDIDADSLQSARENVAYNKEKLGNRIAIFDSTSDGPFFPLEKFSIDHIDFTMCNPPFYESVEDMFASAKAKQLPPSSACTGTTTEMVHSPGGEVSFTLRQFHESQTLPTAAPTGTWFTTMLGKLSSVSYIVAAIKPHTTNYAITEFKQGSTRRWGLAWSFGDRRPSQRAERYGSSHIKGLMPFPTEFEFDVEDVLGDVEAVVEALEGELGLGSLRVEEVTGRVVVNGEVEGNVWSRAARRAKSRGEKVGGEGIKFGFRVEVLKKGDGVGCEVRVRWTRGMDSVLFESFCGMVKRKLKGTSRKE